MEYHRLGDSGLEVSAICAGTMTFGQQTGAADAKSQLDYAFDQGVNFVDTAEMYAVPARAETCGVSEIIVGDWLAERPRERIILATKVAGPGRSLDWIRGGPQALDGDNIRAAVEGSLRRLRTDYIDLYQLHWPARNQPMFGAWQYDPAAERDCTPIRAQLEALASLVEAGKIRYVGVSNEHAWGVTQFTRLADEYGLPRIASIQNAYSLLNRVFEYGLAEVCHRENVSLLAYSPLGFGHLSGKYLRNPEVQGRINLFADFGQRYSKPGVASAVKAYADLAAGLGLTPTALALAFVYRRWFVGSTIIGTTTMAQMRENLAAWHVVLSTDVLEEIDRIHQCNANPAP